MKLEFNGWFLWNWSWCNEILGKLEVYSSFELSFQLTVYRATRPKWEFQTIIKIIKIINLFLKW